MAEFLVSLAEFDRWRLWEPLGYVSLWDYLYRELGLSSGAAFSRTAAARLLQRVPAVEGPLRDGRLCLSSVAELAKVLTVENEAEVLPRFFHRSAREARDVVAELIPRLELPERVVVTGGSPSAAFRTSETGGPAGGEASTLAGAPRVSADRAVTEPLTADLRRLHVTVTRGFLEKLELAREALSHSDPAADVETVLEAGLDLILARQAKRRAQVRRPRRSKVQAAIVEVGPGEAAPTATGGAPEVTATGEQVEGPTPGEAGGPVVPPADAASAGVPAEVRRAVWERDQARCQWRMDGGGICGSTHRLELDHVLPRAKGGPSTLANLRILCERHNKLAARLAFGEAWMARYRKGGRRGRKRTKY